MEVASSDAGAMMLAVRWGLMTTDEVISYSDRLIEKTQNPSAEICELAVASSRFQVEEILGQFDTQGDRLANLKALIFWTVDLTKLDDSQRHRFFGKVSSQLTYDDPKPWSDFKIAEHELEDAIAGVYGCVKDIELEIIGLICDMA